MDVKHYFVNGILTSRAYAQQIVDEMSKISKRAIELVHNPAGIEGPLLKNDPCDKKVVPILLAKVLEDRRAGREVHLHGHSYGAWQLKELCDQLPAGVKVTVHTYGSIAPVKGAHNYLDKRDDIAMLGSYTKSLTNSFMTWQTLLKTKNTEYRYEILPDGCLSLLNQHAFHLNYMNKMLSILNKDCKKVESHSDHAIWMSDRVLKLLDESKALKNRTFGPAAIERKFRISVVGSVCVMFGLYRLLRALNPRFSRGFITLCSLAQMGAIWALSRRRSRHYSKSYQEAFHLFYEKQAKRKRKEAFEVHKGVLRRILKEVKRTPLLDASLKSNLRYWFGEKALDLSLDELVASKAC